MRNIPEIHVNNIAGVERVNLYIRNSSVTLDFEMAWTAIHLSGYSIPVLDLEIKTTNVERNGHFQ